MNILNYTISELEEILTSNGFKKYNAAQICDWIYKKHVFDFNLMTNLSLNLIEFLNSNFCVELLKIETVKSDKETSKYLLDLDDGNKVECALMTHKYGRSLCVSTQVGCAMGCLFCESGRLKKVRNLTVSEMVLQILTIEKHAEIKINNLVIMGIGEPFDNFENLMKFIKILIDPKMFELGSRKITISTCGIVPKIYEFADFKTQVNLAISLHAPFDELRERIMPINKAYKIKELIKSIDYYISKTNRRVTIEYIMLENVNDNVKCANELAKLLKNKLVYVNLIPYNETKYSEFKRSEKFKIMKFYDILIKNNIDATIRREMGSSISAACGQLRAEKGGN